MRAKQYLGQIKLLDAKIQTRLMDRYRLRCFVTSATSAKPIDDIRVQTTPRQDPMGDAVARIVDLEREVDSLIDEYIDKRTKIIEQIESMEDYEYMRVLSLRYVGYKPICEIALECDYTERHTKRLHANALAAFERLYGDVM